MQPESRSKVIGVDFQERLGYSKIELSTDAWTLKWRKIVDETYMLYLGLW
jgi:hypothetical protein